MTWRRLAALALSLAFALGVSPALARAAEPVVTAALSSSSIEQGEIFELVVQVLNPVGDPEPQHFSLPNGFVGQGPAVGRSLSIVNGQASSSVQFRYQLRGDAPGNYSIGPFRMRVGGRDFVTRALAITVRKAGQVPAVLLVAVTPKQPYVGQLTQVAVQLVQYAPLVGGGDKAPPPMPGFWAERFSDARDYAARQGDRRVGVSESRARVYPLAPGEATIGSAHLSVIVEQGSSDVYGSSGREYPLHSDPVRVDVRPLPAGAPGGFAKGVGTFECAWGLDRGHSTQDQALLLRLDVRGAGNLPLLGAPALALPDFEVFASTVDDSFAAPGENLPGRRRFQWTLMPRRTGKLRLAPPEYAWFDPAAERWVSAALPALEVEVLRGGAAGTVPGQDDVFPGALAKDAAQPGSRPAWGWVFALAGALLGLAIRLWRTSGSGDPIGAERAQQREWLRVVGLARGLDFWKAADDAAAWAQARGAQVLRLREDIAAARYGGQGATEDDVRRRLIERVADALPPAKPAPPRRAIAIALALVALASWFIGSPQPGDDRLAVRARAADAMARERRIDDARAAWDVLWREAPGDAALAARLAWSELEHAHVAEATRWVLRSRASEPRDPAVAWAESRAREAGGLTGAPAPPWPLRSLEWAALAFALALGAMLEWPRRWSAGVLAALALAAAFASPLQRAIFRPADWAVVARTTHLESVGVDLEPGQVVRVLGRSGAQTRVRMGREVDALVPDASLLHVAEPRR